MRRVTIIERFERSRWRPVSCVFPEDMQTPEQRITWYRQVFPKNTFRLAKYTPEEKEGK